MLSPRLLLADRDEIETYASGARASVFKADGSGFIYYPSGRVAVYKGIIDERSRYYVYGDDARSTPLGAVDEHAVGFVTGAGGVRLALNKVGTAGIRRVTWRGEGPDNRYELRIKRGLQR